MGEPGETRRGPGAAGLRLLAAAAVVAPLLVVCAPFLFRSACLYGLDFDVYYRPHFELARGAFASEGAVPAWNAHQYCGTPYLGNLQTNLDYPPNWLFLLLPAEDAYEILILLHLILAAGGAYRLARFFGLGRTASVISALAYGLSFSVPARIWAGHVPYLTVQAQAPLLLFLLFRVLRKPTLLNGAALGAWTAAVLLAGNPQFVFYLAVLALAGVAWQVGSKIRRREAWVRPLVVVVAAGGLGAGGAALHLLPAAGIMPHTERGAVEDYYDVGGVPPRHAILPAHLITLGIPWFGMSDALPEWRPRPDSWFEKALYIGVLPLVLALFAVCGRPRGPALFFAVAGLLALAAGMALHLPVHSALSLLPGYSSFRFPARWAWVAVLCLSLVAGFGWDALRRGTLSMKRARRILLVLTGIFIPTAAVLALGFAIVGGSILFGGFFCLSLVPILLLATPARRFGGAAAVVVVALDLGFFAMTWLSAVPREEYRAAPWYARHIGAERGDSRLWDRTTNDARGVAHGFRLLRGHGYPVPAGTVARLARAEVDPRFLNRLNTRWVVAREGPPGPGWVERGRDEDRVLYENPSCPGPAFFPGGEGTASAERPGSDRIEIVAHADRSGKLVVSESWMPGWSALLNGNPVDPYPDEDGLISVVVREGENRLSLRYAPHSRRIGRIVSASALGVLVLLGGTGVALRRRRRLR